MEKKTTGTIFYADGKAVLFARSGSIRFDSSPTGSHFEDQFKKPDSVSLSMDVELTPEMVQKFKQESSRSQRLYERCCEFLETTMRYRITPPLKGKLTNLKLRKRGFIGVVVSQNEDGSYHIIGALRQKTVIFEDGSRAPYATVQNDKTSLLKIL
jgi:hypothetical protein